MLPDLLLCQSLHHAPLWCTKWKVGGGGRAVNHQFKRAQAPLGDAQCNVTQLPEQNFYLLFFSRPGWTTAFLHWEGSVHIIAEQQSWQGHAPRYRSNMDLQTCVLTQRFLCETQRRPRWKDGWNWHNWAELCLTKTQPRSFLSPNDWQKIWWGVGCELFGASKVGHTRKSLKTTDLEQERWFRNEFPC